MTGINYDDLQSYLYVSEDFGKNWKSIALGLPNEPVNVIVEDPVHENVIYAGGFRGVYISTDKGNSWAYLGNNMPGTAIADIEIHEGTQDLVAATHGRGIYKINLRPIHTWLNEKMASSKDYLFEIPIAKRPWFNSHDGEPDYRTLEKVEISFCLNEEKNINLIVKSETNNTIWTMPFQGKKGFNQYRWDLIVSKESNNMPYFIHYDTFLKAGNYKMILSDGKTDIEQLFIVKNGVSPYKTEVKK
jgi:BNR-Asp box repeat